MITLRTPWLDPMQDLEHKLSYAQQESKLLNRHLHESEEARRIQQRQARSIAQMVFFGGHPDVLMSQKDQVTDFDARKGNVTCYS